MSLDKSNNEEAREIFDEKMEKINGGLGNYEEDDNKNEETDPRLPIIPYIPKK